MAPLGAMLDLPPSSRVTWAPLVTSRTTILRPNYAVPPIIRIPLLISVNRKSSPRGVFSAGSVEAPEWDLLLSPVYAPIAVTNAVHMLRPEGRPWQHQMATQC